MRLFPQPLYKISVFIGTRDIKTILRYPQTTNKDILGTLVPADITVLSIYINFIIKSLTRVQ
jgi:hypothetical protein